MAAPLLSLIGYSIVLELLPDRVRLNKCNPENMSYPVYPELANISYSTEILLSSITSTKIEHRANGGLLHIIFIGSNESIDFRPSQIKIFELFKQELDSRIGTRIGSSIEHLRELEKLSELKNKGILTNIEFQAQKHKILEAEIDSTNIGKIKALIEEQNREEAKGYETQRIKQESSKKTNQIMSNILSSVVGSFLIIPGLAALLMSGHILSGFFLTLAGIILTPLFLYLVRKLSKERIKNLHGLIRTILFGIMIILFGIAEQNSSTPLSSQQPYTPITSNSSTSIPISEVISIGLRIQ